MDMESLDLPVPRPQREGGASFRFGNRASRAIWKLTWFCLASWTPPFFSPWRIALLRLFGARVGAGAAIAASTRVWLPRNLVLGPGATLGPGVDCYNMAMVTIGARAVVSQRAFLCGGTHDIADDNFQLVARPVTVGAEAWVAAEAFVGPGVTVGEGSVLGARGCAFTDLRPWTVYRGNPAVEVKARRLRGSRGPAPLRIACVLGPFLPVPPLKGGAVERIWQNLCAEFAAKGHDVTLLSRRFAGLADHEVVDGVRYIRVPSTDAPASRLFYRLLDVVYALRVCRMLPRADITITNSVSLPLLLPRARAGKIYVSVARFPKGQMGAYSRADRLQCVSTHVAEAVRDQSPKVAPLVKAIPNAISSVFATALDEERGPRAKQVIFVGRVAREKGIDLLIRAFALVHRAFPAWRLTIVGPHDAGAGGDGPAFLAELEALARRAGARVDFAGPVFDEAELARRLRAAEVFVYPSVAARGEALPLAPLEAMACGCAVLVSSLDCYNDYLVGGVNGLAFDETDASGASLAEKLTIMLGDDDLRRELAAEAVHTARRFTRDAIATQFIADFRSLLQDPGSPVS